MAADGGNLIQLPAVVPALAVRVHCPCVTVQIDRKEAHLKNKVREGKVR